MTETTSPVAEAIIEDQETINYELAFHVLPTVAEGEVADVFAALKEVVTSAGGSLLVEEAPMRFELAYPIIKRTEGKNRSFRSAYFGWVRFALEAAKVQEVLAEVEARPDILRALVVKLTPAELAHPFYFHEALETKQVVTIDEAAVGEEKSAAIETPEEAAPDATPEVATEAPATEETPAEEKVA